MSRPAPAVQSTTSGGPARGHLMTPGRAPRRRQERTRKPATPKLRLWPLQRLQRRRRGRLRRRRPLRRRPLRRRLLRPLRRPLSDGTGWSTLGSILAADWYTLYWDGSTADKVARRATYPTLEHDNYEPGPLAERIRRDKRERSSDDSSSPESQALRNARQIAFRVSVSQKVPPSLVDKLPSPNHCV